MPRSSSEILQEYAAQIFDVWGNTPLSDPVANRNDPLVKILSGAAAGQSELEHAFEAFVASGNLPNLEGQALTSAAAMRGVYRKNGTLSKAVVMVVGDIGSVLEKGSEFTDRYGAVWKTVTDVELPSGYGMGVVCAEDPGSQILSPRELSLDTTGTPWIHSATNGIMIEVGGQVENDQALIYRAMNRGPMAHIEGTKDRVLAEIDALDGVNFSRYGFVKSCIGDGPMFVISGGNDSDIGETIKLNAGMSYGGLVGGSVYQDEDCTEIRFQRPCPVLLHIDVTLSCDCPAQDADI